MASTSKLLTQSELEEIVRAYEAGKDDEDVPLNNTEPESLSETEDNDLSESEHSDTILAEPEVSEEDSEDSEKDSDLRRKVIYGKNGFKWYKTPFFSKNTRTVQKNIVLRLPGPKAHASNTPEEILAWKLFFSDSMIDSITQYTNQEISKQCTKYKTQSFTTATSKEEVLALFGLLYFSGVLKTSYLSTSDLWSKQIGMPIFRATMSQKRFEFLINCLRFDDKTTRDERKRDDKFAAIRSLWNEFIENCESNYTPGAYVTIDEQLLSFRGRCPFKVYIPNKPDKYGIKIVMLCDSKTFYMCSAIPYVGKERRDVSEALPTHYVLRLCKNLYGSNRNVTMDNWFSSSDLAKKLLQKKLTMVGTLRKNKSDIPPEFLKKKKLVPSTDFAFDENMTLVSFSPKPTKIVLLLSTFHTYGVIDEDTSKPEVVLLYNSTKGGVDTYDQLCHSKTVARKTRRWPLRVFYGMLDGAGINGYVIYSANRTKSDPNLKITPRKDFLRHLALQLVTPQLKKRLEIPTLSRFLRFMILDVLGQEDQPVIRNEETQPPTHKRCQVCPRSANRKGRDVCVRCKACLCAEHRRPLCPTCTEEI